MITDQTSDIFSKRRRLSEILAQGNGFSSDRNASLLGSRRSTDDPASAGMLDRRLPDGRSFKNAAQATLASGQTQPSPDPASAGVLSADDPRTTLQRPHRVNFPDPTSDVESAPQGRPREVSKTFRTEWLNETGQILQHKRALEANPDNQVIQTPYGYEPGARLPHKGWKTRLKNAAIGAGEGFILGTAQHGLAGGIGGAAGGAAIGGISPRLVQALQRQQEIQRLQGQIDDRLKTRAQTAQIEDAESQTALRRAQATAAPITAQARMQREQREALNEHQRQLIEIWKGKGYYKKGEDPTYDKDVADAKLNLPEYDSGKGDQVNVHPLSDGTVLVEHRKRGEEPTFSYATVDGQMVKAGKGGAEKYSLKHLERKPGKSSATARALQDLPEQGKPQGPVWDALIKEGYAASDAADEEGKQKDAQDYAMRQIIKKPALASQVFKDPEAGLKVKQRIAQLESEEETSTNEWNQLIGRIENNVRVKGSFDGLYQETPDNLERKLQQYKKQRTKIKDQKARRQLDQHWTEYINNIYVQ